MNKAAVYALCVITLLTACSNAHLSSNEPRKCPIRMPAKPEVAGEGIVTRLLTQGEAMALLSRTQNKVGAPIDSAYINNFRVIVRVEDGTSKTVLLPYGMMVNIGDHILFQSSYVSSLQLCSYVPTLATRKL